MEYIDVDIHSAGRIPLKLPGYRGLGTCANTPQLPPPPAMFLFWQYPSLQLRPDCASLALPRCF